MPPKLLAFLPCERVIIGAENDNTATLVAILQGYTVDDVEKLPKATAQPDVASGREIPQAIPTTWFIFALWETPIDDHAYFERFELIAPSGNVLITAEGQITLAAQRRFIRWIVRLTAFPIEGLGDYMARLYLKTDNGPFDEVASFPIPITAVP